MQIVPIDNSWAELLDPNWIERLDQVSFLTRCRNGTITKDELFSFLQQHYYYSSNFIRYLCAVISNIADANLNKLLLENLFEEMGFTNVGKPHFQIYKEMLQALNVEMNAEVNDATQYFIDQMFAYCRNSNPIYGLAALCLGAEAIVPHVYSQLIHGFKANGIRSELLNFFQIHIECDDQHAITMKKIIEQKIVANPSCIVTIRYVAENMLSLRKIFFDEITSKCEMEKKSASILF